MFENRIDSEAEFRKFAALDKEKYEKIQIRVEENLLVHKFFVHLYRWCKDFPGGGWSHSKYFVTKNREIALSLRDLEKGDFRSPSKREIERGSSK